MPRSTDDIVKVAVGIIINDQQQVLVSLRPECNPHGGLWEFPGGKYESDETLLQALSRELQEEIGVEVISIAPLLCVFHNYGAIKVELNTWRILSYTGIPYGREGQQVRWVNRDELLQLAFPDGNRTIVDIVAKTLSEEVAA